MSFDELKLFHPSLRQFTLPSFYKTFSFREFLYSSDVTLHKSRICVSVCTLSTLFNLSHCFLSVDMYQISMAMRFLIRQRSFTLLPT